MTNPTSPVTTQPARAWPATTRQDLVEQLHGKAVADPYRWLEDEKAPEVQAWMQAQDEYARAELAKYPGREALLARMKTLAYVDEISAPVRFGERLFYSRKHAAKEKPVYYWKQGDKGAERVLFDPNEWSKPGHELGLGEFAINEAGTYVAYAVKANNADESITQVMEIATGKVLADKLEGTKYFGVSWHPSGKGFYYTYVPAVSAKVTIADRPGHADVRYHVVGQPQAKDAIVHPATGNPETFIGGRISRDGHWLIVTISHGWNSQDVFIKDARTPKAAWQPLAVGKPYLYEVLAWQDVLYVRTNEDAPRWQVFTVKPTALARQAWQRLIPESDASMDGLGLIGGKLVAEYLRKASTEIKIFELNGKFVRTVALPSIGTASLIGRPQYDTAYLDFDSFVEPGVIFETSMATGKAKEWARVDLPLKAADFAIEQVMYPSKDGTEISMFIISKQGTPKDGKRPTLLYGYGGFSVNLTPSFAATRIAWLEAGGVYAMPNLRGGAEYGEAWHHAGQGANKQNVFDDFLAAATYLQTAGWTSPEHLAIHGGSNGGLLVGAAMTQAPTLMKAVVCEVPLLDMLRYHLYGSGKTWIPEYGSAEDAKEFATLWAYSPYRRAVDEGARAYPALLMTTSDHDDRVDPLHARKLVAQIQYAQTSDAPVLLRIERNAGHGGADNIKQKLEKAADVWAFLLATLK